MLMYLHEKKSWCLWFIIHMMECFRHWIEWVMWIKSSMTQSILSFDVNTACFTDKSSMDFQRSIFNMDNVCNCSYKFEFPTPDDRPGLPIISFRYFSSSLTISRLFLLFYELNWSNLSLKFLVLLFAFFLSSVAFFLSSVAIQIAWNSIFLFSFFLRPVAHAFET